MQVRPPRHTAKSSPQKWWLAALALVILFYAGALPVVFSSNAIEGRAAADHLNYHEPVIHTFADEWPKPDLSNYYSATTPLYHLILAGVEISTHASRRALMLAGSVFTCGLLVLFAGTLRMPPKHAFIFTLPVLCSMYVNFPGVWLLPDNAGWLGVLAILAIALHCTVNWRTLAWSGVILVLLVLVRQIHLWAAAVIWTAAWLGSRTDGPLETASTDRIDLLGLVRDVLGRPKSRLMRLSLALALTVPAFVAVAYFVRLWGGVVVPRYQSGERGGYHGWNPATAAFHLSIIGSFVPFYFGSMLPGLKRLMRTPGVLALVLVGALVVTVVPETSYAVEAGRKSGLWNLVKLLPVMGGHCSPVLIVLAPIGAVGIASLMTSMDRRSAWVFVGAIVAFVAAQTASPQLWQRYHEPFILMLLSLMSATAWRTTGDQDGPRWASAWRMLGPVVLAMGLGALSVWTVLTDKPAVSHDTGDFERSVLYEPIE